MGDKVTAFQHREGVSPTDLVGVGHSDVARERDGLSERPGDDEGHRDMLVNRPSRANADVTSRYIAR